MNVLQEQKMGKYKQDTWKLTESSWYPKTNLKKDEEVLSLKNGRVEWRTARKRIKMDLEFPQTKERMIMNSFYSSFSFWILFLQNRRFTQTDGFFWSCSGIST